MPGAAGQGSHGLSDHHAFVADRSELPAGAALPIQLNHTYFAWATIWYSARVETGPPIRTFMVDEENLARFQEGSSYVAMDGTADGPAAATGGTAATIPRGVYHLVLHNTGTEEATVKWEVFLDPRFPGSGEPGALTGNVPAAPGPLLLALLLGGAAAAALAAAWMLSRRG